MKNAYVTARLCSLLTALTLLLSAAGMTHAQATGALEGRVTNADTGAPLPGVNVVAHGPGGRKGTSTDADGRYRMSGLTPDSYRLTVTAVGYSSRTRQVRVQADQTLTADFQLTAQPYGLDEVVVSATRSQEHLSTVPSSITVVGPKELEKQAALTSDLGNILAQTVPGLAPSTGTLSNYGQTLRGRNPFILIEGVPQSTPLRAASRDLRTIDPSAIERIEVVRGASALYGYGATGGAINIVTKRPEDGTVNGFAEVGARFSTDDLGSSLTERALARVSGRNGRFDYLASGSFEDWGYFFDGEGDRVPQDPNSQGGLAGADEYNLLLKGGAQLTDAQRLEASFNYYDFKQHIEFTKVAGVVDSMKAHAVEADDPQGENPGTDNLVARLSYTHEALLGSRVEARAYVQDYATRFGFSPRFPDGGGQSVVTSKKLGARLDVESPLSLTSGSLLRWGADVLRDETAQPLEDGRLYVPPIEQTSAAPFAQLKLPLAGQAVLRGGARYEAFRLAVDDYTTLREQTPVEGGVLNYDALVFNAGGVAFLSDAAEVFGSFAQGFSVADVGRVLRSFGDGTETSASVEQLRPEAQKVNSYELGVRATTSVVNASLVGFINTSELGSTFGAYPELAIVRTPERIRGVEATLDTRPAEGVGLGSTFTYLEGKRDSDEDGDHDTFLPGTRIPPLKLTGYASYTPIDGWQNRLQVLYSGTRDRFEGEAAEAFGQGSVESHTLVDLQTGLDLRALGFGRGTLQLSLKNVLDNFYFSTTTESFNLNGRYAAAPGRRVSLSYQMRW